MSVDIARQNFFKLYTDVLLRLNERLWASANRKHLPAGRIKAVLEHYFQTLTTLLTAMGKANAVQGARLPEGLNLFAWVRTATELDYGLTSLFLIMEDAISTPPKSVSHLLLVATEHSLNNYSEQCRLLTQSASWGEREWTPLPLSALRKSIGWHKTRKPELCGTSPVNGS